MSNSKITDEAIIEMYWNRQEEAIAHTSEKYHTYCFAIAKNILYVYEDSEECVSDTWMHAWNSIPPQRPDILKSFLGKITRNLSLDRYRKDHAQKRGGGEVEVCLDELEECVSDGSNVEGEILAGELKDTIQAFVTNLAERDRNVFIRRYFFMENAGEISQKYGLTEGNVLQILSRTRKKLGEYLRKEGYAV